MFLNRGLVELQLFIQGNIMVLLKGHFMFYFYWHQKNSLYATTWEEITKHGNVYKMILFLFLKYIWIYFYVWLYTTLLFTVVVFKGKERLTGASHSLICTLLYGVKCYIFLFCFIVKENSKDIYILKNERIYRFGVGSMTLTFVLYSSVACPYNTCWSVSCTISSPFHAVWHIFPVQWEDCSRLASWFRCFHCMTMKPWRSLRTPGTLGLL